MTFKVAYRFVYKTSKIHSVSFRAQTTNIFNIVFRLKNISKTHQMEGIFLLHFFPQGMT